MDKQLRLGVRERRGRALEIAKRVRAELVLVADPSAVTWLTGYAPAIDTGPSPFAPPALALVGADGETCLLTADDISSRSDANDWRLEHYEGYVNGPMDSFRRLDALLDRLVGKRKVGIDATGLPAAIAAGMDWIDISRDLKQARAVKDPDELAAIRGAVRLCDVGQRAARLGAVPGTNELEVWQLARSAMERQAGGPLAVVADVLSGPRTALVGGPATARALAPSDLVLVDLVPRLEGYWGDSCATVALREPDASLRRKHMRIREALQRSLDAVRPGLRAGDLDDLMRAGLDYPHHSGHGLGTSYHEEPRIVPGSQTVLRPNMAIALEPGVYDGEVGVRLEQVAVVTGDGCEVLSRHDLEPWVP